MEKKPKNVEFDFVKTIVEFDKVKDQIVCTKVFFKDDEGVYSDRQVYDLCVLPYSVAMQMACAYVQSNVLTEYE